MKALSFYALIALLAGCHETAVVSAPRAVPVHRTSSSNSETAANRDAAAFVTRTTTEDDITLTVRLPRKAILGTPIPVVVELANHGNRPILITYSNPVRFIHPSVWFIPPTAKAPFSPEGERVLGSRDETHNQTSPIDPGKSWSCLFDLNEYYLLSFSRSSFDLLMGVSVHPEQVDPKTGERVEMRFDVSGMRFHMHVRN